MYATRAVSNLGLFLAAVISLSCRGAPPVAELRLLTWNIGNADTGDPHYALRVGERGHEDLIRDRIREFAPDVVFLQEVLSPRRCRGFVERDPSRTCFEASAREPPVRRLLGPDYSIVCDARGQAECVGVRTSFGAISGVALGATRLDGAETPPLPLETCDWLRGDCSERRCDVDSTVSAIRVETRLGPLQLVHLHPMAPGTTKTGVFWGEPCRFQQLRQAFEGFDQEAHPVRVPTLMAGDFNLDPVRLIGPREAELWSRHVGEGRRFRDLTPTAPNGTQYGTRRGAFGMATDHVLVERAHGACTVHGHGIGPDPGTQALDASFVSSLVRDERHDVRLDHFAITCTLALDGADH